MPRSWPQSLFKLRAPANPSPASQSGPAQSTDKATPQPAKPAGKVLFQRSLDPNGDTVSTTGPAAKPASQTTAADSINDAERKSITITGLDLDVRLNTAAQQLAARALVTVRNKGTAPLSRIPLQISSSLNWERIRIAGRNVTSPLATINSDADHTGQLHEAAVPLAAPLAPGATVQLDVTYSGTIAPTARRLVSVGTPEDSAAHSDWDEISPAFTGLRGFGNVVWYPVSSIPVIIGDGARLFDEIGRQKLRSSGTAFRLRLTVEFPHGQAPTIAVVNGNAVLAESCRFAKRECRRCPASPLPTPAQPHSPSSPQAFSLSTEAAHAGTHLTAYTLRR